jgi:uncharacterized protein (TIGR04551 family)
MKRLLPWWLVIVGAGWTPAAQAQGMGPGTSPNMGQEGKTSEKPAGPAEAAPEEKEGEPEIPPLPAWPGQESKKLQLFQMRGYFRFRWNMHHKLNLGLEDVGGLKAPFYTPISERLDPATGKPISNFACSNRRSTKGLDGSDRGLDEGSCPSRTLGGADMRLRLEPTINVSEQVRIYTQIDVFDNIALGSTPAGLSDSGTSAEVPMAAFSDSQAAPVAGRNSSTPAILVKRAWAEVGTPVGQLRFGRMPSHWGLGLLANDGGCWNCNAGDNADRLVFTTELSNHTLGMGYDFASSGPNSLGVASGRSTYGGQAIDLEKLDDVHQWFWMAGRIDPEEVIKDKVERGELVLNYGLYLLWRKQDFDYSTAEAAKPFGSTETEYTEAFLERHAWTIVPDLWFKLMWRHLYLEFEGAFRGGKLENSSQQEGASPLTLAQFGWALRSFYGFFRDTLHVGLEVGMASGDSAEPLNNDVNRRRSSVIKDPNPNANDTSYREFRFHDDYQVDLILFRELLTTVANAAYFKPSIQYMAMDTIGGRLDLIYSLTHDPVGYPGNSRNLGVELDLDIFYRNLEEGFFAGIQYGVLFPLGALDRPAEIFGPNLAADAEAAHTLQGRLIVKF